MSDLSSRRVHGYPVPHDSWPRFHHNMGYHHDHNFQNSSGGTYATPPLVRQDLPTLSNNLTAPAFAARSHGISNFSIAQSMFLPREHIQLLQPTF